MKRVCLLSILLLPLGLVAQHTEMFRSKPYAHASVGICVLDLKTGKVVSSLNPELAVTPASVMKLATTGAALELLGPDFRFTTRLTRSGEVEKGVLKGDLIMVGGGDPTLGSRQMPANPEGFLTEWTDAVRQAGINRIDGRIIADASAFDDEGVSPFWLWEDIGNYYATGIYGLNAFDNSFRLQLRSGAAGTRASLVSVVPDIPGLTIDNQLTAADNDQDSAYLYGAPFQAEMRLFGTMPANRTDFSIRGQMPDPPFWLAKCFDSKLRKAGIPTAGTPTTDRMLADSFPPKILTEIAVTRSMPLTQILRVIHEKSDNFYTECLLRRLEGAVPCMKASARDALRKVKVFWGSKGLDLAAWRPYDACGLSPNDRITARFLAEVLRYMATRSVHAGDFEQSIPLAGREGTVSGFLKGTVLEGELRLKSGSNQVVNSYAGYYRHAGKAFAVVIIVNHADATRSVIRRDMETFLLSL